MNLVAFACQLSGARIKQMRTKTVGERRFSNLLRSSQHGTYARQQFVRIAGFADVVVGSAGKPVKDPSLLLTAILADATNLGLGKMAESCLGTSPAKQVCIEEEHC